MLKEYPTLGHVVVIDIEALHESSDDRDKTSRLHLKYKHIISYGSDHTARWKV